MRQASGADSVGPAYDGIVEAWQGSRAEDSFKERPLVDRLVAPLPPEGRILDLGCGSGEPIGG